MSTAPTLKSPTPTILPAEADPVTINPATSNPTIINPWEMPARGLQWCDCGEGCELDRDWVTDLFADLDFFDGDRVPHLAVARICQVVWNYTEVCEFFNDHVNLSAQKINGKVAKDYAFKVAVDIVAYFTKTWQGCPRESLCEGGFNFLD